MVSTNTIGITDFLVSKAPASAYITVISHLLPSHSPDISHQDANMVRVPLLLSVPLFVLPFFASANPASFASHDQKPIGWVHPDVAAAEREGFFFENPETDCRYVSQPFIYKQFKTLETDGSVLFSMIHRDVHFTIVGSHPGAGVYHDLMHFYVNALRRVAIVAGEVHPEAFRVYPKAIHGGCNTEWSVQEMNFQGISNAGGFHISLQVCPPLTYEKEPPLTSSMSG
jgi:hypothetical protein